MTPEERKAHEAKRWVQEYTQDRVERGTTPVVQNLLHKKNISSIAQFASARHSDSSESRHLMKRLAKHAGVRHDEDPAEALEKLGPDGLELRLRSRRAQSGVRCPKCGKVGYYRVNCPTCSPVKIDVTANDWRPVTPEDERIKRERKEYDLNESVNIKDFSTTCF